MSLASILTDGAVVDEVPTRDTIPSFVIVARGRRGRDDEKTNPEILLGRMKEFVRSPPEQGTLAALL